MSHKELEESGVRAEKLLRGESTAKEMSDADLMRTWEALHATLMLLHETSISNELLCNFATFQFLYR